MVDNIINIISNLQKRKSKSSNLLPKGEHKERNHKEVILGSRAFGRTNKIEFGARS